MTPEEFIDNWRGTTRSERSAAQEHFLDLCELLGVDKPGDVDRHGTEYTFEKSTRKIGDTTGFADVWKRKCFAWEYKGDRKNLVQAYAQLKQYADALENPPLLIVSDMQEIRVHTNFTNTIAQQHVISLAELRSVESRELLRNCFLHPERLLPTATRESVTALAASEFAKIAVALRRQYDERRVAHFINKLVFCLFAEDIDLLPDRIFADILDEAVKRPDEFEPMLHELFRAMANRNGRFGTAAIPWFNGGLFDDEDVLPLGIVAVHDLMTAARLDWKAIDPTIFGTLFESGLDDKKRAEMASLFDAPDTEELRQAPLFETPTTNRGVGIHYTDEATIMKIIEPVVIAPWAGIGSEPRRKSGNWKSGALAPTRRPSKAGYWLRRAASIPSFGQASAAIASSTRPAARAIFSRCHFAPSRISISRYWTMRPQWGCPATNSESVRKLSWASRSTATPPNWPG